MADWTLDDLRLIHDQAKKWFKDGIHPDLLTIRSCLCLCSELTVEDKYLPDKILALINPLRAVYTNGFSSVVPVSIRASIDGLGYSEKRLLQFVMTLVIHYHRLPNRFLISHCRLT